MTYLDAGYAVLIGLGSTFMLWIFYICVMGIKRVKDEGKLSKTAYALGSVALVIGYALDFFVNVTVMTVLLLELPQETTVTSRLKRHLNDCDCWRKSIAAWAAPLLDPFDPSGKHL